MRLVCVSTDAECKKDITNIINLANHSIDLMTYTIELSTRSNNKNDGVRKIAFALAASLMRGVKVRLICSTSLLFKRSQMKHINDFINLIQTKLTGKYMTLMEVRSYNATSTNISHAKIALIDSDQHLIVQTGNLDCDGCQSESSAWHNISVRFDHLDASNLRPLYVHFEDIWNSSTIVHATQDDFEQKDTDLPQNLSNPGLRIILNQTIQDYEIVAHLPCFFCIRNSRKTPIHIALYDTIDKATKSISIISPNIGDTRMLNKLVAASHRGVQIQILTSRNYANTVYRFLSMSTNTDVQKKFGQVLHIRLHDEEKTLHHTKLLISDNGKTVIIGSANFEPISLTYSGELAIVLRDSPRIVQESFVHLFNTSWNNENVQKKSMN
jgi:phosphatidylserine/phosphatidylglycerophosphate/cardiolipin synthase-like enzyme